MSIALQPANLFFSGLASLSKFGFRTCRILFVFDVYIFYFSHDLDGPPFLLLILYEV